MPPPQVTFRCCALIWASSLPEAPVPVTYPPFLHRNPDAPTQVSATATCFIRLGSQASGAWGASPEGC